MFKNYDLRPVKIGCFSGVYTGGHATTGEDGLPKKVILAELDENTVKDIICMIDEENSNAIDIFSGDFYPILKRDKYGRITEEPKYLETNYYYALNVYPKEKLTASFMYRVYCNCLADSAYSKYQKNFAKKVKVLTLNSNHKKEK